MKFVNDIIKEYGVDKVLHFLVGALMVAMASITGIVFFGFTGFLVATFIMIPVVYVLSYVKEKILDDKYDILDIKAAMLGAGIVVITNVLLFGLNAIIKGY